MITQANQILFGIVCYREKFWEATSFKNLIHLCQQQGSAQQLSVFIYDNTDLPNWHILDDFENSPFINLVYQSAPANPGISVAYNTIARYARDRHYSHIVFLDQDTELPAEFLATYTKIVDNDIDIAAPLVYENNILLSPSRYKNYRSSFYPSIESDKIELKNNSCINSGLLVKTDFYHKVGGYDENLRLDFCDHEFIKRAATFTNYLHIVPVMLQQNFSTNTNSETKALARYALFTKDMKAFAKINKNDFKITLCVDLPHLIRLTLQYKSLSFIRLRFFKKQYK